MNCDNYIGKNLRRERKKAGFGQMRLARMLLLDQTTISRFENGSRQPSINLLKKISTALGCSFAALVGEELEGNGNILKNIDICPIEDKNDSEKAEKIFLQTLLARNPGISVPLRSLADRSRELSPEDWQFLADHLIHAFGQVEILLDRKTKKKPRGRRKN